MTTPMDDTLTVIGRQLSVTYLPTVLEPLPRELNDMVAQLVAFEMTQARTEICHASFGSPVECRYMTRRMHRSSSFQTVSLST